MQNLKVHAFRILKAIFQSLETAGSKISNITQTKPGVKYSLRIFGALQIHKNKNKIKTHASSSEGAQPKRVQQFTSFLTLNFLTPHSLRRQQPASTVGTTGSRHAEQLTTLLPCSGTQHPVCFLLLAPPQWILSSPHLHPLHPAHHLLHYLPFYRHHYC